MFLVSSQVDCSNVGELYKIRFETENSDQSTVAWQLETVDIRDVDTNEEIHLICNKWMCKTAPDNVKVLHPQLFRELPVIRIGLEPLPGLYIMDVKYDTFIADNVRLQFISTMWL